MIKPIIRSVKGTNKKVETTIAPQTMNKPTPYRFMYAFLSAKADVGKNMVLMSL